MRIHRQLPIRIGTRGSELALAQAHETRNRLLHAHPVLTAADIDIQVIRTTGDKVQNRPLSEIGGKGLFTKEIEDALLAGTLDLAVHSMKDMPTEFPAGLGIVCLLEREHPGDAFISPKAATIAALPQGAVVGSSSLRRQAILLRERPDLKVVMYRGNVGTRLAKLAAGEVDATLLAAAGLHRLELQSHITSIVPYSQMLPAVAQGAIGIEIALADTEMAELLAPLNHRETEIRVSAERAFLAALDGSCKTPIAALAELNDDGQVLFRGQIIRPDGSETLEAVRTGAPEMAAMLGRDAGEELRRKGGKAFFDAAI
ncbi:MAG TPA: hydroxymethylbilane synthase [Alphaproteobacteria bacterium]|jgi:hydroxymethylbilane synthase|nr:hydroxymethylbilane synthase [Alphaproteobacteria bacterium]HBC55369.1 hydroxymethylbilane synthase [Alphaproteobacteria bacterium]